MRPSNSLDRAHKCEFAAIHGDGYIADICFLVPEGDGDRIGKSKVWAVLGKLNMTLEETNIADADNVCMAFAINF